MHAEVLDRRNVDMIPIIIGSLLIALGAKIKIPLGFTPVPVTCQTIAVLTLGVSLGSKRGAIAAFCYLLEGAMGLPVFANGGGISYLLGPTGGYLLTYPLEAFLFGLLLEKGHKFFATLFPCLLQLAIGSIWMIPFVGIHQVLAQGFHPFFLIEISKAIFVVGGSFLCKSK